jgi:hypothetical protein
MLRVLAAAAMAAALAAGATACTGSSGGGDAAPSPSASRFASTQYGVSFPLPPGWNPLVATEPWDGGDIDHTAPYADRIFTPGSQELFILGQSTARDLQPYVDTHTAWLSANRGCAAPAATSEVTLDGQPARLLEIHCPEGIFGPTLVLKAVATAQGHGVIVTSFTPDGNVAEDSAAFKDLVESMSWEPGG